MGNFAKGFIMLTAALCGFAIFEIASSAYEETAWVIALFMTIPLAIIIQQYVKNQKKGTKQST